MKSPACSCYWLVAPAVMSIITPVCQRDTLDKRQQRSCKGVVPVLLHARPWIHRKPAFGPWTRAWLIAIRLGNKIQFATKGWHKIIQDSIQIGLAWLGSGFVSEKRSRDLHWKSQQDARILGDHRSPWQLPIHNLEVGFSQPDFISHTTV